MKIAVLISGIVLILFSLISLVVVKKIFGTFFGRVEKQEYTTTCSYEDFESELSRELLTFPSGANQLQGYLYGMDNTKGLVVISHGLGGSAENYLPETACFVKQGYQVFSYDNTGYWRSEGKDSVGLSQAVDDLDAALNYIEREARFQNKPVYLFGHSWGGYAVTAVLKYHHSIKAVVSVAGFNSPLKMILEWGKDMMGVLVYVEYPYMYLYQKLKFGKKLGITAVDSINQAEIPVLLIHGSADDTVHANGAATFACRKKITNPKVKYVLYEKERQNGHMTLLRDIKALEYVNEIANEYNKLVKEHGKKLTREQVAVVFDKIDKQKANQVNAELFQIILQFYETV